MEESVTTPFIDQISIEYLEANKSALINLTDKVKAIKLRARLPLKNFGKNQIDCFAEAAKEILLNTNTECCKQLLLKLVSNITVGKNEITVRGANFRLAEFVSKTKMGTPNEVPTFITIWR